MKISMVVAMDEKGGIGKNHRIPWHLRDDLIRLKKLTVGNIVILGRKTYDSMASYYDISGRTMPGKMYLVITREKNYIPSRDNVKPVSSVDEAITFARRDLAKNGEVFIIGGGQIFKQSMHFADKIYLTIVEGDFNCDTFFPDYADFKNKISEKEGESEDHKYKFLELER